jgi:hypothetical protein
MKTVIRGILVTTVLVGGGQFTPAEWNGETLLPVTSTVMAQGPDAGQGFTPDEAVEGGAQPARGLLDPRHVVPLIVVSMFLGTGVIIAVLLTWSEHRSRVKALDVLRLYAARNEEPPASVVQALTGVSRQAPQGAKPPPTRGHHLAHAAANVVFVLGAIGIVWWKAPDPDNPGGFVIFAILAGLFFAAGAAARFVGAIYARE